MTLKSNSLRKFLERETLKQEKYEQCFVKTVEVKSGVKVEVTRNLSGAIINYEILDKGTKKHKRKKIRPKFTQESRGLSEHLMEGDIIKSDLPFIPNTDAAFVPGLEGDLSKEIDERVGEDKKDSLDKFKEIFKLSSKDLNDITKIKSGKGMLFYLGKKLIVGLLNGWKDAFESGDKKAFKTAYFDAMVFYFEDNYVGSTDKAISLYEKRVKIPRRKMPLGVIAFAGSKSGGKAGREGNSKALRDFKNIISKTGDRKKGILMLYKFAQDAQLAGGVRRYLKRILNYKK